ncbi:MAG: methyl-accepting chemotaxis protein [Planctomycetaceae bacterium]|jgi:methyl-accepting chemotaxis protein|nr:methyl-accepting chemotaxis protein [Planctomycetaceae bacterium]
MLNKFKIGTKLIGGFVLVLLLLVLVALGGYFGLTHSIETTSTMTSIQDTFYEVQELQISIFKAQIAATNGVLYRDTKFADDRKKVDEQFQELAEQIKPKMLSDNKLSDNKDDLEKLISTYKKYIELDNDWYKIEADREKELDILRKEAEQISASLKQLSSEIEKAMEMPEEAKEIEGHQYFSEQRTTQLKQINHCSTIFARLRRFYYQYFSELKPEKKQEIVEWIEKNIKDLRQDLEIVGNNLSTNAGKKAYSDIISSLEQWQTSFLINRTYLDKQNKLNSDQNNIIVEMDNFAKGINERITKQTKVIRDSSEKTDKVLLMTIPVVSVFAFLVGMVISFGLSRNITRGLASVMETLKKVVLEGDLGVEIKPELTHRSDEVGEMAVVGESILNDYKTINEMATALAEGDWRVTVKEKGTLDSMNQNLSKMLDQVNRALREINETVKQVATGSGEVSSAAQTLSSGAQESAASLEEITASMSEISSQTKANAQSASEAHDLAQKATHAAADGQEAMKEMTTAMDRITKNSTEIQRVIKVIDDIAFQTNLLALNAAVEAARAGAHGKGFAVVAEEVRNLAARSAKAAKETTDLIQTSGQEINRGGEVAAHTSEVLNTIVDQIKQTTSLIAGIAVASNEQAQGVAQVTIGLQQIDAVTQQNTAAAEESASAANEMSSMAANLQQLVAKFQLA